MTESKVRQSQSGLILSLRVTHIDPSTQYQASQDSGRRRRRTFHGVNS